MFSKIIPSFLTVKEGSTSHPYPLSSGAREKTALLGARDCCALRLADHQRSSPYYAGWDRRETTITANATELQTFYHLIWEFAPSVLSVP